MMMSTTSASPGVRCAPSMDGMSWLKKLRLTWPDPAIAQLWVAQSLPTEKEASKQVGHEQSSNSVLAVPNAEKKSHQLLSHMSSPKGYSRAR